MDLSKEKFLITGANGLTGREFFLSLKTMDYAADGFSRTECDITSIKAIEKALEQSKPTVLVNCAAYTDVDKSETEADLAFAINCHAVEMLAEFCKKKGIFLVHLSTDYVFNGLASSPYTESQTVSPISQYARSKVAGENALFSCFGALPGFLNIRTSRIFGIHRTNFIKKVVEWIFEKEEISVVDFQRNSPTYTKTLVSSILKLLELDLSGTFNVTNSGSCNWYELAVFINGFLKEKIGKGAKIKKIGIEDFPFKAKRPAYSVLSGEKFRFKTGLELQSWETSVKEYLNELLMG